MISRVEDARKSVTFDDARFLCSCRDQRIIVSVRAPTKRKTKPDELTPRPWGFFESLSQRQGFHVKLLTVFPGQSLSLQRHQHRAEHWTIIEGQAKATVDSNTQLVGENESVYIPVGAAHRLENPTLQILRVVEVQVGESFGEDDIVRITDRYGRVKPA